LATIATDRRAGMRYYAEIAGKPVATFDALLHLADRGDAKGKEAIAQMCRALGRGMHMIASALAPREIVVVGDITAIWAQAFPIIDAEMRRNPLVGVPTLRPAHEGNKARLSSAVALIMNEKLL